MAKRKHRKKIRKQDTESSGFRLPPGWKDSRKRKKKGPMGVSPLWDLDRDGVTYSFLSKFQVCPERTRLNYVEGYSEVGVSVPLEFGNLFHAVLEYIQAGNNPELVPSFVNMYGRNRLGIDRTTPDERMVMERIMGMVEVVVPAYLDHWEARDKGLTYLFQEETFEVLHTLPSGRTLKLRGRWDAVFYDDQSAVWLQENKTKQTVDEEFLQRSLSQDLQTMLYCISLQNRMGSLPAGVLYNVIRRPALRQRVNETLKGFLDRLKEDIAKRREFYFMRWTTTLEPADLELFKVRTLDPLLQRVCDWWDSIKLDPLNPDYVFRPGNREHYQRPFGIYDSLSQGQRGDYFDLLTKGNDYRLARRSVAFPELEN